MAFLHLPPECHANTPNNIKQQSLARVFMLFFCQPISTDWMLLEKYYSNTSPSNSSKMDIPTTLPGLLRSLIVRTCDGMLGMFWQQDFMVIAVGFTPPPWPVLVVKSPPIACKYSYLIIRLTLVRGHQSLNMPSYQAFQWFTTLWELPKWSKSKSSHINFCRFVINLNLNHGQTMVHGVSSFPWLGIPLGIYIYIQIPMDW